MKANITEYLRIDLDRETWECRRCEGTLVSATESYKRGLLVHDRSLREVHRPLLDPERYAYTFAPDPAYTALLEYYCPHCGTLIETEYTVPGHPPARDIELDLVSLRRKFAVWGEAAEPPEIPDAPGHVHRDR